MRKLLILPLLAVLAFPLSALAGTIAEDTGLQATAGAALVGGVSEEDSNILIFIGFNIIQPILGLVGLIFMVLMLYAGLLWMTAGGNTESVKKAKQIFLNAIIGVIIITAAYALTSAVFNAIDTGDVNGVATE